MRSFQAAESVSAVVDRPTNTTGTPAARASATSFSAAARAGLTTPMSMNAPSTPSGEAKSTCMSITSTAVRAGAIQPARSSSF
jgi:hypothetical protein